MAKVIDISTKSLPEWLNEDIEKIMKDSELTIKPGYVISRLYNRYSFGYRYIFSMMTGYTEWVVIARERLEYIDENIELILKLLKRRRLISNTFSVTNIKDIDGY